MSAVDFERNAVGTGYGDIGMASFSDKNVRQAFIRKVYGILTAQLVVTLGVILLFVYVESIKTAMYAHPMFILIPGVMTLVLVIVISCCRSVARKYPLNVILLAIFTLCESVLLGFVSAAYEPRVVWIAVATTAGMTLALTLFAFQTKWDLTIWNGCLIVMLFALIMFGFLMFLVPERDMSVARKIYGAVGVVIFGLFIIIDTQMLIGGKRLEISPEEYVFAALNLYLDIINLFLDLLRIFGNR